jgi:nucleotide-binding universal stress UspA family protein
MMMNILLAIDRSRDAKAAAKFLQGLRLPPGSSVSIIHVAEVPKVPPSFVSYAALSGQALGAFRKEIMTKARRLVGDMADFLKGRAVRIKTMVRQGVPDVEIFDVIAQKKIDLVVLGTRGLSCVRRFILGSLSESTVTYADCSVLVVRNQRRRRHKGAARELRIVVAVDHSAEAMAALAFVTQLGFPEGTRVALVHVVEKPTQLVERFLPTGRPDLRRTADRIIDAHKHVGEHLLEEARLRIAKAGLVEETVLVEGHPAEELVRATENLHADLVIVGSRGFSGMKRILLGSVSRRVARHAPCSVLIVRSKASTSYRRNHERR